MIGELIVHLEAETQGFVRPVQQVKTGLDTVSNTANETIFSLNALAKVWQESRPRPLVSLW